MKYLPDTFSDRKIKACLKYERSFSVIAGAGSGKTTSLIKALDYIRHYKGSELKVKSQKVVCITYTNRAVDVIRSRLNSDELFLVSTLHSFLWSLIGSFAKDIKEVLIKEIIPRRIEKKKEDDTGKNTKTARKARSQIQRMEEDLKEVSSIKEFKYDAIASRNHSRGILDHDDIIEIASCLIKKHKNLRKIIAQQYPYIFVDEAQDTFPEIVESLNLISNVDKVPVVGYFGDPMQQIFDKRAGDFSGPLGSRNISKPENYRCSKSVIKLLNSFRKDLKQVPAGKNVEGSVEVRLIKSEEGNGYRKSYSEEQLDRALQEFDKAVIYFGWKGEKKLKQLFLARQMIARRLKFPKINDLFTGKYSSRSSEDGYESGEHYLLKPFLQTLVPIVVLASKKDNLKQFDILKKYSPLVIPNGENQFESLKKVSELAKDAVEDLLKNWKTKTTKDILKLAIERRLIKPTDRLVEELNRDKRIENYDEEVHGLEKGDWLADEFFSYKTEEIIEYATFMAEDTPYSTQHGVKGEEYEKILVLYDDTEASWNNYNFSRLFTPLTSGKEPTEGQKERGQKLAYVAFSRAEKDLRIILFTPNPNKAKSELIEQKLFTENQITVQI